MRRVRLAVMVGLVVGLAGTAAATSLTIQRGLDTCVVKDIYFAQGASSQYGAEKGRSDYFYTYGQGPGGDSELGLIEFDLTPLADANATSITSATMYLYRYSQYGAPTRYRVEQIGQEWVEGTVLNYWDKVDGAGHRFHHPPIKLQAGDWQDPNAGEASYRYLSPSPLVPNQRNGNPGYKWVFRSTTYPDGIRLFDFRDSGLNNDGEAFTSLAALEGGGPTFANGFGYFYDTGADILYMRMDNDSGKPADMCVVDETRGWNATTRLAAGGWTNISDSVAGTGVWVPCDMTEMVQRWEGLDGFAQEPNYGVQVDEVDQYVGGRYRLSEYAADQTLRPMLVVEFEGLIPEPAGLGLIGLALMTLRRRRG